MLMLHAGLDLSRRRLDVCLIGDGGQLVGRLAAAPDADGLRRLVERVGPQGRVRGVIELPDPAVRAERDRRAFGCIRSSTARCSSTASTRR
jgi:hypothetical protein